MEADALAEFRSLSKYAQVKCPLANVAYLTPEWEALESAIADSTITQKAIELWLAKRGISDIKAQAIGRHRRKDCACNQ